MLDIKRVGVKIASLRKEIGYSQEKLANLLCISPQAISKWENGHTLPETSLLPVLAQIFNCNIDDIIMPAYSFDEKIEEERSAPSKRQAEQIAEQIINKLQNKISLKENQELSDEIIIDSLIKANGNIGICNVTRENTNKVDGNTLTNITVSSSQREFNLIEKRYGRDDAELYKYNFASSFIRNIPQIFYIEFDKKIALKEDLSKYYIQGCHYDENTQFGDFIRNNYKAILASAAKWHSSFWENDKAFEQIGLNWRLESPENIVAHLSGIEKDFKKYKKNEEDGLIPKVWETFENNIDISKISYFEKAIDILKTEYIKLIETRFLTGKNITVVHGDMHAGTAYVSTSPENDVKFDGLQAVRMGLCTEDLAMLIALHIEPSKEKALPLLDYYYNVLCETVKDYSYDTFMNDYKISIMENMFFTVRLINRGIYDYHMRDKAMKAFETFVLNS